MRAFCPQCLAQFDVGERVGWKAGAALGGAIGLTKSPLLALLAAGAGAYVGHKVEEKIARTCPTCLVALQVIEPLLEG